MHMIPLYWIFPFDTLMLSTLMFPNINHSLDPYSPPTIPLLLTLFTAQVLEKWIRVAISTSHSFHHSSWGSISFIPPRLHLSRSPRISLLPNPIVTSQFWPYLTSRQCLPQLAILSVNCLASPSSLWHQSFLDFSPVLEVHCLSLLCWLLLLGFTSKHRCVSWACFTSSSILFSQGWPHALPWLEIPPICR